MNKGFVPVKILGNLPKRKPPLYQQGLPVTALGVGDGSLPSVSVTKWPKRVSSIPKALLQQEM